MALSFESKQAMVAEVNEVAARALAAVAAEYRGLTAGELSELREKARDGGTYLRVVKNTLARRALEGTDFECMGDDLTGPLILGFSLEDPGSAARVISDFSKDHDALVVRMVSVGGEKLPASDIKRLADLPTREQALAMLMGVMLAPVTKFVRTTKEPVAQAARAVAAVRDQKQAA